MPSKTTKRGFFHIELRGIGIIPDEERTSKPRSLFFLWAGTTLTVFTLVYGATIIALGLSFTQAVAAIIIGNLLGFALMGLTSLQGARTGTSTQIISRAAFGVRGARVISFFAWLTLVGFEAGGFILIVLAVFTLLKQGGVDIGDGVKIAVIAVTAIVQLVLPLLGYDAIMKAEKYFTYVFAAMFAIMAILIAPKVDFQGVGHGASFATFTIAIALVMSAGGLSWAVLGSDYTRYLGNKTSKSKIFVWASLGGFIPYVLLMTLGAAVASVVSSASDPISGLPKALPAWFFVPYLLLAIVTLLAVNTTDLYSSGLNLQATGLPIPRWVAVVVDLVLCVIIAWIAISSSSFNTFLNVFLSLVMVWLAPWIAIYLVDWLLRRGRYDPPALFSEDPTGPYWGKGGVNIAGIIALAVGMFCSLLWLNSAAFVGPLSKATGQSDLSFFTGAIAGGIVYWALARRSFGSTRRAESGGRVQEPVDHASA